MTKMTKIVEDWTHAIDSFKVIPRALIATSKAAVPFDTVVEYFLSTNFENFFSIFKISGKLK